MVTPRPPRQTIARQRQWYACCAWGLILLGLLLLARQLELITAAPWRQILDYWPALLIAGGLVYLLQGRPPLSFPLPTFSVERNDYVGGQLTVNAETADVQIDALAANGHLATGQFPAYRGPRLRRRGRQAHILMEPSAARPFLTGDWKANLLTGVPWTLDLQSTTGHFTLNLGDLNLTALNVNAVAGNVELTLPAAGPSDIHLKLSLGDLTVRLPEQLPAKICLSQVGLAEGQLDPARLRPFAPGVWVTPGFATPNPFITLTLELAAGQWRFVWI